MIRITFNDADIRVLRYERYHHPHLRVQKKAEALLMKSHGLKHKDICKFMGILLNTFREYLREYLGFLLFFYHFMVLYRRQFYRLPA